MGSSTVLALRREIYLQIRVYPCTLNSQNLEKGWNGVNFIRGIALLGQMIEFTELLTWNTLPIQSVTECQRVSQNVREYHRVSQSITECHRVSQSITECHRMSQSVAEIENFLCNTL